VTHSSLRQGPHGQGRIQKNAAFRKACTKPDFMFVCTFVYVGLKIPKKSAIHGDGRQAFALGKTSWVYRSFVQHCRVGFSQWVSTALKLW
jgi:hypothetical protein